MKTLATIILSFVSGIRAYTGGIGGYRSQQKVYFIGRASMWRSSPP